MSIPGKRIRRSGQRNTQRKRNTSLSCNGKRRFRDQQEAQAALLLISNADRRSKTPARAYHCDLCAGWHLTSMHWHPNME